MYRSVCNFILISLVFSPFLSAQNLVPNGDFEAYDTTSSYGLFHERVPAAAPKHWKAVAGSPDYLNKKIDTNNVFTINEKENTRQFYYHVYPNWLPKLNSNACAGIIVSGGAVKEFLSVQLIQSLKKGHQYYISFNCWTKLPLLTSSVGVVLSNGPLIRAVGEAAKPEKNIQKQKADSVLTIVKQAAISRGSNIGEIERKALENVWFANDTANYILSNTQPTKIQGLIEARGGEQVLNIGNFLPERKTHCKRTDNKFLQPFDHAFIWIDDIILIDLNEAPPILFDSESASISPSSFAFLDDFANYLKNNPDKKVNITGHTDDTNTPPKNMELSLKRAEAVKAYFKEKGVTSKNLTSSGKGDTQPIADNKTTAGRALNRRVEITIHQ